MQEDDCGYQYPVVQKEKCIHCGKCLRTCAYQKKGEMNEPMEAYAAVGRSEELIKNSASGGVFASIATQWRKDGGMIAGAVMDCGDAGLEVYHILSDRMEDLYRMQGSKYVQSEAWRCYGDVCKALRQGKKVLFSGTPCQVAAIKSLTGDPENLVTIDLVCHGVPPRKMFGDCLAGLGKRLGGKIIGFQFRDKSCGKQFCAKIDVRRGKHVSNRYLQSRYISFYKYFLEGTIYRESCYSCPYAKFERISDITLGDYWGIEKYHIKDIEDGKMHAQQHWSCLLVNTGKGKQLLDMYCQKIRLYESRKEWVRENNQQLNLPSKKPEKRTSILNSYIAGGYKAVDKYFAQESDGVIPLYWRIYKNLYRNQKLHSEERGNSRED